MPKKTVNICRINTQHVRRMNWRSFNRAISKKVDPKSLLGRFMSAVALEQDWDQSFRKRQEWFKNEREREAKNRGGKRRSDAAEVAAHGVAWSAVQQAKVKLANAKTAAKALEMDIWDAQQIARCKLPDYEEVARDAERQHPTKPEIAAELRRKKGLAGKRRR